jgi:anti-anti-sigma regulatory factor
MLKITIVNGMNMVTLKLEGKLAGPWVDELKRNWRAVNDNSGNKRVLVELSEVTFVDADGRNLLTSMYAEGTRFRTFGCMAKGIVEGIVEEYSRSR